MTAQQKPRVHRLSRNHREWSPPQVIYLTAASTAIAGNTQVTHSLQGWTARIDVRHETSRLTPGSVTSWGNTAGELAAQVDLWCKGQRTVWLYSWSLSWALSITRLPAELAELGWEVTAHAVASDSPWVRMRKRNCVLTMADGFGWLRGTLREVAGDVGDILGLLADDGDGPPKRLTPALHETIVLAEAMSQIMDWWDKSGIGSWALTGSGGGWNSYRHKSTGPLPLIIPGSDEAGHDRLAIYGGRREAFQWGQLQGGPWLLADFKSAYPTIAAHMPLPLQRLGDFDSLELDSPIICGAGYGIIAEVEIETSMPRWPVRSGGRIAYPVGRFTTTLAGPEISEARRLGCLLRIGPGRLHGLSWHMQEWAQWVLDVTSGDDQTVPVVARRAVKHWGRAVIGKFAAHGFQSRPLKSLGGSGWISRPAWNAQLQAQSWLTEVCGAAAETIQEGDGDNAYPAILAFVESWTRVFLARAMDRVGASRIVCCDTDGMILRAAIGDRPVAVNFTVGPLTMRIKASYDSVRVIGPQQIITDTDRKLAGVPRTASENSDGSLQALLWPKLAWQMSHATGDDAAAYIQPRVTYHLPESTITGWRMPGGKVMPLLAVQCPAGGNHLLPIRETTSRPPDGIRQASHLSQMTESLPGIGE